MAINTPSHGTTAAMELRPFGPTGRDVPVIGQVTWFSDKAGRSQAVNVLRYGLDLGMTHIDTAELYGSGEAEKIVGQAISGRRHEMFLILKVLTEHASREGTLTACERSLDRLRTDHLECYLMHWRGEYPLEGTIASFEQLKRQGKFSRGA